VFPENGFDHVPMVLRGAPRLSPLWGQQGRQPLPHVVTQETSRQDASQGKPLDTPVSL
jgi:hypothetical protein